MKPYSITRILLVFLSTVVIVSCHKEKIGLTPTSSNNGFASPVNNVISDLSPVIGTDRVFYFLSPSIYPISCNGNYCTVRSRYILHNDSTFLLQYNYDKGNDFRKGIQYKGWYSQLNNSISITWDGWSSAGAWGATGTLRGDTLTVGYNTIMSLIDFEDAVYLRK